MAQTEGIQMPDQRIDELIIDKDDLKLLEQHKERIQQIFQVEIEYGLSASDQVRVKQWVTVKGEEEDRKNAKVLIAIFFFTYCLTHGFL